MPRQHDSLFGPIAFAIVAAVFAAGAGYTWWVDHRAPTAFALTDVRAAPMPALGPAAPLPSAARPAAAPAREPPRAPGTVLRCIGADEVPIFTSGACPDGSRLDKRMAVEVRDPPRGAMSAPAAPAGATATAIATVNNYGHGDSYEASRQDERRYQLADAERRCERARLRERSELEALGLDRKMRHVRQWADYVVGECAEYKVLTRRR